VSGFDGTPNCSGRMHYNKGVRYSAMANDDWKSEEVRQLCKEFVVRTEFGVPTDKLVEKYAQWTGISDNESLRLMRMMHDDDRRIRRLK
jgi:hypothetical protein